ncbi:MAG: Fmu (Sun) domain-containing protein, partial [Flavisolibacter sp.]
ICTMRSHSYINTTKRIIDEYDGSIPLSSFLKQFFKEEKKFGSTDRKQIAHACYCYYRVGKAFESFSIDEKILRGIFLCSHSENIFLKELKHEWIERVKDSNEEKISILDAREEVEKLFPFTNELSNDVKSKEFYISFLIQPDLFLRLRPGKKQIVISQLKQAGVEFEMKGDDCISIANQTKIDEILHLDADAVVQDFNSQKVLQPLQNILPANKSFSAWDCCAASGGKSILLLDRFPKAEITVSDVRESILINLKKRFRHAAINNYSSFIIDLSSDNVTLKNKFDLVICDAPCSGSGTWNRTPEQLFYFQNDKIDYYSTLQKKIAMNASAQLKSEGYFLYVTCSVFEKENEEVVEFISKNTSLKLVKMEYLKGYDQKADTLFTALLKSL